MKKQSMLAKVSDKIQETIFGLAVSAVATGYAFKLMYDQNLSHRFFSFVRKNETKECPE